MLSDRHVHTPYCLHGSSDAMENYVKVAIEAGLESLTFTEHAPLPMEDPLPDKDSSMRPEDVDAYLAEVRTLAKKYEGSIEIHAGFELDYLEGKETETRAFLEKYPETVPHSILSVHFVQLAPDEYFCIDLDRESFTQK
ncbi:histidinol-phosphatase HisJ, partial [Trichococcus sp.]|uniref:histidinol-phosphatase HisJ n=1 Tax=Trichococcus sp. TaxID=1985464 RepID=UPI003C7A4526